MNTQDKETDQKIKERIREIDKRIAEIKLERKALNREKHLLSRCCLPIRSSQLTRS
jgi:hypothetical protein